MKEHVLKLLPGEDILECLSQYCHKHNIEAAYIATCVGSLSKARFRKGISRDFSEFTGPFEIVSLVGTLSHSGMHVHGSLSDDRYQVIGGHFVSGCLVQSTAEIVIVELEEHQLSRTIDDVTGHKALQIKRIERACK